MKARCAYTLFLALILCLAGHTGLAQRYDKVWVFGCNVGIDFTNLDTPRVIHPIISNGDLCASFSPPIGDSLIYIDQNFLSGSRYYLTPKIRGEDFKPIIGNNSTLNGPDTFVYLPKGGYTSPIFLDMPWSKNRYLLLTTDMSSRVNPLIYTGYGYTLFVNEVFCDSSRCIITSKNNYENRFIQIERKLTAVRHSNGFDWWIITKSALSDTFIKFLLTQNGILGPFKQEIGSQKYIDDYGYLVASPQGDRLLNMGWTGRIDLFDFNRCNGELSNYTSLNSNLRNDDCEAANPNSINKGLWGGGGFSPDGKLIYLSTMDSLFQIGYDTIPEVGVKIYRELIWVDSLNQNRLISHALGPNGKYYILMSPRCTYSPFSTLSGLDHYLSVVEKPNNKRLACLFKKDLVNLNPMGYSTFSLPNMPNYRLGASATPCNFTARELDFKYSMKVYPNPSSGSFTIETPADFEGSATLFNLSGQQVYSCSHAGGKQILNYVTQSSGIYLLRILGNAGEVHTQKIVVE